MPSDLHLTPHLDAFVRAQLHTGRFQTRDDLISAALSLLEKQGTSSEKSTSWSNANVRTGQASPAPDHAMKKISEGQLPNHALPATDPAPQSAAPRRSPRGMLADLRSDIDPEDIKEARSEMWSGHLNGHAG
jgi:Arc/MetJ-type ribon-helix-helix transcriptional regulator